MIRRFALVVASALAMGADAPSPAPLQEAVLSRALFLLARDTCIFVEKGAPTVPSWKLDDMATLVPAKATVPRCAADAPVPAIVDVIGQSVQLALANAAPDAAVPKGDALEALVGKRATRAEAVKAAFDALYVKPDEARLGVKMRALYQATVKDTFARIAKDTAALLQSPARLASEAKRNAKLKGDQGGKDAWRTSLNALVKTDEDAARIDPRLVGFVLRRQSDGTLPVLVECLRTVLADYDPASAALLPSK